MRISDWSSDVCSSDLHKILERDLRSLAHVDLELLRALRTEVAARTPDQTVRVANADAVIEEVEEADLIVITCPIYASSIPSTLKAWIEYMNSAGRTRSEERRVGKECDTTCRYRWSPYTLKTKSTTT